MALRLLAAVLGTALFALAVAAPAPAAPSLRACRDSSFRCGTLQVPLDRTGAVPGTIPLRFAIRGSSRRPLLVALSGGPGQPGVALAEGFAHSLRPLLRRYRLVVVDQRGTGDSGLLRCPSVERLRSLDPFTPEAVGACAQHLGPRRAFFTSADTVLDLDALRAALGSPRLALMGISYGTHVALQYARAFPGRTDRLVLDSIVGPDGPDPFLLDTYRFLPRVLREQCAGTRCRGITDDPVADAGAFAARLAAGPVSGRVPDDHGRLRLVTFRAREEAPFLLVEGDLNPFLQAALPGALAAARRGDDAPLLRLRAVARGARTAPSELSFALNVTTGCTDGGTPYPLATPPAERPAAAQAALGAIPPADYAPFDAQTVFESSYGEDCLQWPQDAVRAPFTGPLPDVPAVLFGGAADLRTPVENAVATQAQLPRAALVRVAGIGHDVLDSDITGCAARALDRFARGAAVGAPCRNRSNAVRPVPRAPRALDDFRSAPGVGGDRGRVVFAAYDTLLDAELAVLQRLYAGLGLRAGGLRRGAVSGGRDGDALRLSRYELLTGLPVSGQVSVSSGGLRGTVRVGGRLGGTLTFRSSGAISGTLGGRRVAYRPARGSAASAGRAGSRRVDGPVFALPARSPDRAEQQLRRQRLRR